jgi:hypothetical protein
MTTPSFNGRLQSAAVSLFFVLGTLSRSDCSFSCHGFQLSVSLEYHGVHHKRLKHVTRGHHLLRLPATLLKASPEGSSSSSSSRNSISSKSEESPRNAIQELREKANKLRQEAGKLESTLRSEDTARASPRKNQSAAQQPLAAAPVYKDMNDSTWTFTYRFAGESEPNEDQAKGESKTIVPKFSGKLTLHFRKDGFTDVIKHEPMSSTASSSSSSSMASLNVVKAWGWDLESSNEDDKEYLLFSVDAILPSGPAGKAGGSEKRRFYMQARQDRERNGAISLQGGTVTVKQDVSNKAGSAGFAWSLVPKGILAQFRFVGDFAARPTLLQNS